jgi:S1-C subfamily serine protease
MMIRSTALLIAMAAAWNTAHAFAPVIIQHHRFTDTKALSSTSISPQGDTTASTIVDRGITVASKVQPSVALVTPMGVRNMKSRGSGFVVDLPSSSYNAAADGTNYTYLITAAHVAAPGYDICLSFPPNDTTERKATVMARNQTLDLALLRIQADEIAAKLNSLSLALHLPPVGTTAFAHGYPASRLRGPAMTTGIVCGIADGLGLPDDSINNSTAALQQQLGNQFFNDTTTFVVTDAAMAGGMSGGPLTDSRGTILGVNALIRPDLRALGNYAVSAQEVRFFLNAYLESSNANNTSNSNKQQQVQYQVLLFNDPMNKKQRVASVLEGVAKMNNETANKVMMQAHTTGSGIIQSFQDRSQADELCQALKNQDLLVEVQ